MYKIVRNLLLVSSLLFFLIGLALENPKTALIAILMVFVNNIMYSVKKLYERVIFFSFNVTFFVFLIGRMVMHAFFGYSNMSYGFSLGIFGLAFYEEQFIFVILTCIYISLVAIYIGYLLIQKVDLSFLRSKKELDGSFLYSLRTFSLVFFYFCLIFRYYNVYEMTQVASVEGYYESYATFTSSLPGILVLFSSMFDVAFFAYLATNPSKKRSIIPILLYLGEGLFATFSGRRSLFMLNLLIVFVYFCIRNVRSSETREKKWLGKFEWTLGMAAVPSLIVFMNIIGRIRGNSSVDSPTGFLESIKSFFHSQGISANVIGYTRLYEDVLPKGKLYTFGPLMEFIDNKIIRPLKGMPELWGQTQERALEGYLFTHTISFFIMPTLYLSGVGYGSSFIAELFHDFSYFGVFLGSLVYGSLLFVLFYVLRYSNYILIIFALLMTRAILFAPRAAALSFIVSAFTMSKIVAVIIILFGAKLLHSVRGNRRIVWKAR